MTEFEYQEKLMACLAYKEMTIEECNKFFDTLKNLVLEHPIVADWWMEIMDRYDDILQKKGATNDYKHTTNNR